MTETDDARLARLQLMAKAFEHASEAILISDAQNRILAANPAFTRMTGYTLEDVVGREPAMLASGNTPPETYADMWRTLESASHWQGEIWDRRKDGGSYPKLLSISVARDADGRVENYIASFSDISEYKRSAARLSHLAHHDVLTGLYNRVALDGMLKAAIESARRDRSQLAVLLIDLDNFKQVNDTLGHHTGDMLLLGVARRLKESVRASDIVARLSGDEFVILLKDIENPMAASALASKLQLALADPHDIGHHTLYAAVSMGISIYPSDGETAETLVKNAESAMYHAKSAGRDNFVFFAASMNEASLERLELENALRRALQEISLNHAPQFELYFQPQVHNATGQVIGLEALARWTHPRLGNIPPAKFIPIAEETGLIQPLGDWVFWEACRRLRDFKAQGISGIRVAVNLSTQQLRHENLPVTVHGALACYDLLPSEIELEITESAAMQNPVATIAILQRLEDMGIVLAIDDFGTGYSSLSYLKDLPIHRLKLDRSFVSHIDSNQDDAAICSAVIMLGHSLGLDLVAEGVETEAQLDHLTRLRCDLTQGFLYSRPLPAGQVVDFIQRWNGQLARH